MTNQLLQSNLSDYIIQLAQKPNAKEHIELLLHTLFENAQKERQLEERREKSASSLLVFTTKELAKMPQKYRKQIEIGKIKAHVTRRPNGLYEIRCQINKVRINASSMNLEECKKRFFEKLSSSFIQIDLRAERKNRRNHLTQLIPYMEQWLEVVKKPFVKETTYVDYVRTAKTYIFPAFKNQYIEHIRALDLQSFISKICDSGRNRTAKKAYQLLSTLFDYAVADGIITLNPIAKVKLARYEQEHGVPLTVEEENTLIQTMQENPTVYHQAYAFILYTGIRRSELASVEMDGEWIRLLTAKQRKGMKEKYRSIPISPMLQRVLPYIDIERMKTASLAVLTNRFKDIFPNHHLHDLRHTFITRAQECGIRREIVSLWAGHKADSSITTTVYTHFQERSELQLQEMKKYNYEYK